MSLLLLLLLEAPLSSGTIAVVPPEPVSAAPETAWIGEAVADALPRALARLGEPVVERADRLRVQEMLGIPKVPLTRATCIRIAEALGASWIVVGTYDVKEGELTLGLRLLDTGRGTLSAPFLGQGKVDQILSSLHGLAWDIALASPTPPRGNRAQFVQEASTVSFEAFRTYAQALATSDAAARQKLLKRALTLDARFDGARLALGRQYLDAKENEAANEILSHVPADSPHGRSGRFLRGVALLGLGRYQEALSLYGELEKTGQSPAVLNNEAIALLRLDPRPQKASDVLKRAVEAAPGFADLIFNLGWSLLVEGDGEAAAFWLRGAVREEGRDTSARLVLIWALRRAGKEDEATDEWKGLTSLAPSYESFSSPDFSRRFERILSSERLVFLDQDRRKDAELASSCVTRAEKFLQAHDAEGALRELGRAVVLDPYSHRVHRAMAEAQLARGEKEPALTELRMSLFCKEDPELRVEVMGLLEDLGRGGEARAEASRILKEEPGNEAARRMLAHR